jgi:hypothetical protein
MCERAAAVSFNREIGPNTGPSGVTDMTRNYVIAIAFGVLAVLFIMLPRIQSASAEWLYCVDRFFPPGKDCMMLPGDNPFLESAPVTSGSGGAGGGSEKPIKSMKKTPKPIKSMKKVKPPVASGGAGGG